MARNVNQPARRERTPLNLVVPFNTLPKHLERVLPKFHLGKGVSTEDHLKRFYVALSLLNVDYEDVVCIIFQYNFESKSSSWYFSMKSISIVNWDGFEKAFLGKFGN